MFSKYFKAFISYEGVHRVETFEYPEEAVREALLNAIAHKDYSGSAPIQISVYKDKIMIWNEGQLPENWTVEKLLSKHPSIPYNPDIANAFFRSGYIEAWGRGFLKMINQCLAASLPEPLFYYETSGFWVVFRKDIINAASLQSIGLNNRQVKAMLYTKEKGKISNKEYQELNNISKRTATNELTELTGKFKLLTKTGTSGAGISYRLHGAKMGQKVK